MICLSFDTDHMDEARLSQFLQRVIFPGTATFFCTQVYECLKEMDHEVAPHPFLSDGEEWLPVLRRMRESFPDAVGWRSHSCVFSHILAEWLGRNGYRYASTSDQFGQTHIRPVRQPWGVWHLPIYYMDNMDFSRSRFWGAAAEKPFARNLIDKALVEEGLYVFDFHPIHLLLNTPDPEHYFSVRDRFRAGKPLSTIRYGGYGAASYFVDLCQAMSDAGVASLSMGEALELFESGPVIGSGTEI